MKRVAVIGANGQVGAEICLMLADRPGIDLVPVCRTRSGSAFLRWKGIGVRHGRIADPAEAVRLIGDCDVIVNSSLATGTPSQIRRVEDSIVRCVFEASPPGASVIHFSTQSVYGDPRAGSTVRWRNPYGRVKLATEHSVQSHARRQRKSAYILRLGHVCGLMQEISESIRRDIRTQAVVLPADDRSSNTVHVAAIVDAIEQVLGQSVAPGIYDLMNHPRWTWREVYEFEAAALDQPLHAVIAAPPPPRAPLSAVIGAAVRLAAGLAAAQSLRNAAAKCFAYVPQRMNDRAMAWWYRRRAGAEIAALGTAPTAPEHLSWVENGRHFFPADRQTRQMLQDYGRGYLAGRPGSSWPDDLPSADANAETGRNIAFTSAG